MKNCCNTTIFIPTQCPKCQEIVDSCCVIHEDALPCIFPDPETSFIVQGSGSIGLYTITATTIGVIKKGDILFNASTNLLVTDGAVVTGVSFVGGVYTLTLDKPNIGSIASSAKLRLVRYRTNTPQCEINEAINDILCDLSGGGGCCSDWNPITNFNASGGYSWENADATGVTFQEAEYLTPSSCNCNTVKLRGTVMGPWLGLITLMFTLPTGIQPLKTRIYSVNVTVVQTVVPTTDQDILPATVIITGTNVYLRLKDRCCYNQIGLNPARELLYVSLEGISFETTV
jgi:hypothetical protein